MQNPTNLVCFFRLKWILKRKLLRNSRRQRNYDFLPLGWTARNEERVLCRLGCWLCSAASISCLKRFLLQTLYPFRSFLMKPSETWVLRCPLSLGESEGITGPWVCCLINSKSWLLLEWKLKKIFSKSSSNNDAVRIPFHRSKCACMLETLFIPENLFQHQKKVDQHVKYFWRLRNCLLTSFEENMYRKYCTRSDEKTAGRRATFKSHGVRISSVAWLNFTLQSLLRKSNKPPVKFSSSSGPEMPIHLVQIPDAMFFVLRFENSVADVCGRTETMFSKCISCKFEEGSCDKWYFRLQVVCRGENM